MTDDHATYDCCTYDDSLLVLGPPTPTDDTDGYRVLGMFSEVSFPTTKDSVACVRLARPLFARPTHRLYQSILGRLAQLGLTPPESVDAGKLIEGFGLGLILRDRDLRVHHAFYAEQCAIDDAGEIRLSPKFPFPMDCLNVWSGRVTPWTPPLLPDDYKRSLTRLEKTP